MKDFFKNVFATVAGLFLFGAITFVFGLMTLIGMIASDETGKGIEDNSVLVLNLSGEITEQGGNDILGKLTGNALNEIGLNDLLSAIRKAKENDKIKGIYIETDMLSARYATLQELRKALQDFRKSGKWIVSYGDLYTQSAYYLASVGNKVFLNPQGKVDWHGLASQPYYIKDLAAKFGVKYQVVKVGTYKSATEFFTETKMSDANRAQVTTFLGGTWDYICREVSESRGVSVKKLNEYADKYLLLAEPEDLVKNNMVDRLLYADQVKAEVKKLLKIDADDEICQVGIADMRNQPEKANDADDRIAVYYAQGDIVQNSAAGMFTSGNDIVAKKVCKDLEDLMNDDDVKAVVVRVNSPGGSALASEVIYQALSKTNVPIYVSMSETAASGGYYISMSGNKIFADNATITGSIGVVSMIPKFYNAQNKYGVKANSISKGKYSDMYNPFTPLTEESKSKISESMLSTYKEFKSRVSANRKLNDATLENYAQGKIWLGDEAKNIKLVDEIGGLEDTINAMAKDLKLEEGYRVENIYTEIDFQKTLKMLSSFILEKVSLTSQIQARLPKSAKLFDEYKLIEDNQNKPMYYLPYKLEF